MIKKRDEFDLSTFKICLGKGECGMGIEIELSFFHLKKIEVALRTLQYKNGRNAPEELLGNELLDFLQKNLDILGAKIARRKNIQDIISWIKSPNNLEKNYREHKIIQEVLMELLKN